MNQIFQHYKSARGHFSLLGYKAVCAWCDKKGSVALWHAVGKSS